MAIAGANKRPGSHLWTGAAERLQRPWFATVLAASVLCLIYLLGFLANWGDVADRSVYANLGMLPPGLATTILAWSASQTRNDRRSVWAWRLLALGFAGFFVGDALYFTYQNLLGKSPFPSLADAGYLIYYPLIFAGLLFLPTAIRDGAHRVRLLGTCLSVVLGAGMLIAYFFLLPLLEPSPDDLLAFLLSVGYPVGDLFLLAGIVYLFLGRGMSAHLSLYLLGAGLIVGLAADLVYGYQSLQGSLQAGGLSDAGYMLSWILFAWASYSEFARADSPEEG